VWRDAGVVLTVLNALIGFAVIAALFAVIFKMLPRVRLSWHDVSIGALGTAALFTLGKYAIGAYIGNSGVASSLARPVADCAAAVGVLLGADLFPRRRVCAPVCAWAACAHSPSSSATTSMPSTRSATTLTITISGTPSSSPTRPTASPRTAG
jgi:hypothetical protein